MYVLQPDADHTFVTERDPYHPLLPQRPGVFALADPTLAAQRSALAHRLAAQQAGVALGAAPASLTEALQALADNPHPLETLSDPGAYLESGSISRYHNPDNYTKALGRVAHGLRWPRSLFAHAPAAAQQELEQEGGGRLVVEGLARRQEMAVAAAAALKPATGELASH
jgi:hypothetical protein